MVVTLVEFFGGLALVLGLFTRWAAVLIACDMLVAVTVVHLRGGFFLPKGFEYALTMLAASIALALAGPGAAALLPTRCAFLPLAAYLLPREKSVFPLLRRLVAV